MLPAGRKGKQPKVPRQQKSKGGGGSGSARFTLAASDSDVIAQTAATMPPLAGKPLEPPRFHPVDWQRKQKFTEKDDPDRTAEPWQPPSFAQAFEIRELAATKGESTAVEELRLPAEEGSFARVVRGVLSQEQCAELLAAINKKGFTPALLNMGGGCQQLLPYQRDGHRVIVDSVELAAWLFEALRPHLPAQIGELHVTGLNERLRFLLYKPGQVFREHVDSSYTRPEGHDQAGDVSSVTVQVYLHDVPSANGGATTFFPGRAGHFAQQPEAGSVLLFTQDLPHEGSLVKAGLKYTLRTEVMYSSKARPQGESASGSSSSSQGSS